MGIVLLYNKAMNWFNEGCSVIANGVEVATILGIKCVIGNLLRIITPLMALAATGMIIFAGAKIISSGDNPKEYQAGMQTLTYAIIGLVGLGLAWVILQLISAFTGANVTDFKIQI